MSNSIVSSTNFDHDMPLLDHFRVLKRCVFISLIGLGLGMIGGFFIYAEVIPFLIAPFLPLMGGSSEALFIHTLSEGFVMKFKLSLILGAILSFPIHLFTFIYFVVPALKRREKWWLAIALLVSFLLVIGSLFISYSKIIPLMVSFLTTSGFVPTNVKVMLNFQSNISTILQFIIYTLLLFQLPILLEFLLALNIVSRKALWKASRYVILGTFILCAIVTPPDIISQVGLALPLIGLYFVTILIAKICGFGGR